MRREMRDFLIVLLSTTLISLSLTHNNRHYGDWVYYSLYAVYTTFSMSASLLVIRPSTHNTALCCGSEVYPSQSQFTRCSRQTSRLRLRSSMSPILTHNNNLPPCQSVNLKCSTHTQHMIAAPIMPRTYRMQTQPLLNLLILMASLRFLCLQILLTSPVPSFPSQPSSTQRAMLTVQAAPEMRPTCSCVPSVIFS